MLRTRESPQTHATVPPSGAGIHLVESIENPNQSRARNPNPTVPHLDQNSVPPLVDVWFGDDQNRPPRRCELDRVVENIEKDPLDLLAIGLQQRQVSAQSENEVDLTLFHPRSKGFDNAVQKRTQSKIFPRRVKGCEPSR